MENVINVTSDGIAVNTRDRARITALMHVHYLDIAARTTWVMPRREPAVIDRATAPALQA